MGTSERLDIEGIRKRVEPMRRTAKHMPAIMSQDGRDLIALMDEVDRLSAERDALAKDRARLLRDLTDRDRDVQHMREVQIPHIEQQNAQRMAERNRYSGQILHTTRDALDTARAEIKTLQTDLEEARGQAEHKESILGDCGTLLCEHFGDRVYWERHEVPGGIQSLIEQVREEVAEVEKLRAELEALRAPMTDAERALHEYREQANQWIGDAAMALLGVDPDPADESLLLPALARKVRGQLDSARALVEQCRPVVEAVAEFRSACAANDEERADTAYHAILNEVPLPSVPWPKDANGRPL